MLMTILFYIIVIAFALIVILWSVSEMMHNWQIGAVSTIIYAIGVIALLVRMIAAMVTGQLLSLDGLLSIFSFCFGLCCCYLQFSLMGTMIAPLSAFLLIALEMSDRFLQGFDYWLPMVGTVAQPWMRPALVLAMVGLAIGTAGVMLAIMAFFRKRSTNENTNPMIVGVTMRMPRHAARLVILALLLLTLAMILYGFWCQILYGVFWVRQPLFVVIAAGWMLLFGIKGLWLER